VEDLHAVVRADREQRSERYALRKVPFSGTGEMCPTRGWNQQFVCLTSHCRFENPSGAPIDALSHQADGLALEAACQAMRQQIRIEFFT
jgi:hypothetical protein